MNPVKNSILRGIIKVTRSLNLRGIVPKEQTAFRSLSSRGIEPVLLPRLACLASKAARSTSLINSIFTSP